MPDLSIGQTLEIARTTAGLTLAEISETTRIRRTVLDAIEHDEFARCGGDFYARGHIRSIARVVGIDPEPLVDRFDAELADDDLPFARRGAAVEPAPVPAREGAAGPDPSDRGTRLPAWQGRRLVPVAGGLLAVLLGAATVQVLSGDGADGTAAGPMAAPTADAPAPAAAAAPPVSVPPRRAGARGTPRRAVTPAAAATRDHVTITLATARGRSWVSVRTAAGKRLYEGMLPRGEERTFTAKGRLRLVVGDAGAVDLVVNGEDLGAPGEDREVARAEFKPLSS